MKSLLILITVVLTVVECKPVADSSKLPHSREFYAGYIKAITDNFDQLFETDRQTRSTKEEDENKTKDDKGENLDDEILKQKRDIVIDDDFDQKKKNTIPSVSETSTTEDNIPVEEDFKESPAVKRAVVQEGSGNSEDESESVSEDGSGSEGDDVTDETTKKTNENEDEKETEKVDSNIIENKAGKVNEYTPEKDVVGLSSRRSEQEDGGGPPGDEEEDIREANADMQKSSRDQSPDDLAKMAQSTVTFLPTNVRNYKASPYVKKVFHYDPQPIPYGGFRSDAEVDGEPMPQRHFAGMHAPNGMYNPMAMGRNNGPPMNRHYPEFGFMFPRNPERTSNHAETRNQIENALLDNKVASAINDNQAATASVPVGEPESLPPSQIVDLPLAPETDVQVKALKKDGCCCDNCCCEQHCCCCHPVCHHVTHHHHHMNDICHHKHHHDIYHHETKVHPHHECCHHVYNHKHIHPHEHCHVCHHHEKQIHHHHPCCCCHDDCCHHDDCHHDDCCHNDCGCHDCGHHDGGYGGGSSNGGGSYGGGSY